MRLRHLMNFHLSHLRSGTTAPALLAAVGLLWPMARSSTSPKGLCEDEPDCIFSPSAAEQRPAQGNLPESQAEGIVAPVWEVVGPHPPVFPSPVYIPRRNIICIESKEESLKPLEIFRAKGWVRSGHSGGLNGGRGGWVCASQGCLMPNAAPVMPYSWGGSSGVV